MKNRLITLCPNCGEPLIWTFINPGAEWYCLNCKSEYGMFGGGEKIDEEHEKYKYYVIKHDTYEKIFRVITKDYIPVRSWRAGCKKCQPGSGEYHNKHLTKIQKLRHDISDEILNKITFDYCEDELYE